MVTALQFIVLTLVFYMFTSVLKLSFECVNQIALRRQSWICCSRLNYLLGYLQRTPNSPSYLWIQICCNKLCDCCLPQKDIEKVEFFKPRIV